MTYTPTKLDIAIGAASAARLRLENFDIARKGTLAFDRQMALRFYGDDKRARLVDEIAEAEAVAAAELALRPDVAICRCGHISCEYAA